MFVNAMIILVKWTVRRVSCLHRHTYSHTNTQSYLSAQPIYIDRPSIC